MRASTRTGLVAFAVLAVACSGTPATEPSDPEAALLGLCQARDEADRDPAASETAFYAHSHQTLHVLAQQLQEQGERPTAGELLLSKQAVEQAYHDDVPPELLQDRLGVLLERTATALTVLARPPLPC